MAAQVACNQEATAAEAEQVNQVLASVNVLTFVSSSSSNRAAAAVAALLRLQLNYFKHFISHNKSGRRRAKGGRMLSKEADRQAGARQTAEGGPRCRRVAAAAAAAAVTCRQLQFAWVFSARDFCIVAAGGKWRARLHTHTHTLYLPPTPLSIFLRLLCTPLASF